jgi:hypothetical protein
MRAAIVSMALACCVATATVGEAAAQQALAGALCADKPNLRVASAPLSRIVYLAGMDPGSVAGAVLMIDIDVSIETNGGADALRSRMRYLAQVKSLAGAVAEEVKGTTDVYSVSAGDTEVNLISIMASKLGPLLQPSGELAGTAVLRVEVDTDNEISECDEADNSTETTSDIKTAKVVE